MRKALGTSTMLYVSNTVIGGYHVSHKYDIIVVVETWLSACILDQELLIPGYLLAHKDKIGGVAIIISAIFLSSCCTLPIGNSSSFILSLH